MRPIAVAACCIVLSAGVVRADVPESEQQRLADAAAVLQARADTPEREIPADTAHRAACVIVVPSLKKAAFIVGGEFGKGVMTCRTEHGWSAPLFMQIQRGSIGFQAGAEEIDLVLLVMNRTGANRLLGDKVTLGANMSIAAGPMGGVPPAPGGASRHAAPAHRRGGGRASARRHSRGHRGLPGRRLVVDPGGDVAARRGRGMDRPRRRLRRLPGAGRVRRKRR